jgi:aminopeptidase
MGDPRIEEYARLLVERCIDAQPGWQVLISSSPPGRPLVEAVAEALGRRGAYALLRITFDDWPLPLSLAWAREAPEELVGTLAPIDRQALEQMDALIRIQAPENTRAAADLAPARLALLRQAQTPLRDRTLSLQVPWVTCQFPTAALAQDANMSLRAYEDFLYGACLLDWDAEGRKMARIAERFNAADQVRIVGHGTDLTLSLKGRHGQIDDGHFNMPGGEVFYSPVETSADGVVSFAEFPAVYGSNFAESVRLVFKGGRIAEASASAGEEFLLSTIALDEGAHWLGELGIGCNPGIRSHMKNTLFDEKIYGSIHLAIGAGFPFLGGTNTSAVHWDMVKDLRQGGQIYCDGELVQENGAWVF